MSAVFFNVTYYNNKLYQDSSRKSDLAIWKAVVIIYKIRNCKVLKDLKFFPSFSVFYLIENLFLHTKTIYTNSFNNVIKMINSIALKNLFITWVHFRIRSIYRGNAFENRVDYQTGSMSSSTSRHIIKPKWSFWCFSQTQVSAHFLRQAIRVCTEQADNHSWWVPW